MDLWIQGFRDLGIKGLRDLKLFPTAYPFPLCYRVGVGGQNQKQNQFFFKNGRKIEFFKKNAKN